jgi:CheY-like chemotaxis protein
MNGELSSTSRLDPELNQPHRILLIDDEPAVLRLVTHLLRKAGYEVASAQSAQDAMGFLRRFHFDCILSDAMMPDLNGFDFIKLVREEPKFARIPILMLTRNRTLQDVKRAVDLGVSEYIVKPIDPQLLLEKLESCLAKSERPMGRFFELTLTGEDTQASVLTRAEARAIGEAGITLAIDGVLPEKTILKIDIPVFKKIGITPPHLRLIDRSSDEPCLYRFSFVGLTDSELKKIRVWLQRESARRRKS